MTGGGNDYRGNGSVPRPDSNKQQEWVARLDDTPAMPDHNLAAAISYCDEVETVPEPPDEQNGVYVGMKVRHGKFGVGIVRKTEGEDEAQKVVVWFNSVGPKKLMLRFAGLERA